MYFSRKLILLCSWENSNFLSYRAVKPMLEAHSLNSGTLLCSYVILVRKSLIRCYENLTVGTMSRTKTIQEKLLKLHQPSSNISELSKGQERSGGLEDTLPSSILSHLLQKGRMAWLLATGDACDQDLMARATVFSTLLLPSAESSTPVYERGKYRQLPSSDFALVFASVFHHSPFTVKSTSKLLNTDPIIAQ